MAVEAAQYAATQHQHETDVTRTMGTTRITSTTEVIRIIRKNSTITNCPQPEPEVRYVDRIPDRYVSYEDMWDIQIQFKADSYNIDDFIGNRANLYNIAQWMAAHPDAILILEAYADNHTPVGWNESRKRDHNTRLASNRGQAVGRILRDQYGIPDSRLEIVNYGQDQQVYPGTIYRCNRCVLFKAR